MSEIMVRFDDLRRYCEKRHCGSVPLEYIKQMPTIEAEPVRRGRWKKKNGEIYCTNCKKSKWSESFELMLRGFSFCPKCGAKMDGGANDG